MVLLSSTIFLTTSLISIINTKNNKNKQQRQIETISNNQNKLNNQNNQNKIEKNKDIELYDVIIVGSGPAGATAAYYLGKNGLKVALIDKKQFPRPKPCGDAWCKPGLDILEEMGVLKKMEDDKIVKPVQRGGFISPFGYRCINTDGSSYGSVTGCKTYAIKRYIADEYLVKAAIEFPNVHLFENTEVTNLEFITPSNGNNQQLGYYQALTKSESNPILKGTICLICDGSTSYLAQKLGVIPTSQPDAVCSHSYVKGGTHTWKEADGVMLFNKSTLPGYSALFRHYNDDVYFGTYILPGGKATSRAIAPFEEEAFKDHEYVRDAFGSYYGWEEKRVVAPIRCGGVPKSYSKQLLVVGDAAGHVDPLTGEGIHTAIVAGKIAGETVSEMFQKNNFTIEACRAYHLRCYDSFGYQFYSSQLAASIIYQAPILLDAVAVVGQRRGQSFLDFFGEVMTGVRPKSDFIQPSLIAELTIELLRQIFLQYIWRIKPLINTEVGVDIINKQAGKKSGTHA